MLEYKAEIDYAGFSKIILKNFIVPEVDYGAIDLSTEFLGKKLAAPLIVIGWTGGSEYIKQINEILAKAAQETGIGFGCGSQYAAIVNPEMENTFSIIKDDAPSVLKIANIGAVHLIAQNYGASELNRCIDMIDADAIALYVNTLEEVLKPDGIKSYKGLLSKLKELIPQVKKPIILKGYGNGVTRMDAISLHDNGIRYIDISGYAGPNEFLLEEYNLFKDFYDYSRNLARDFENWGISTVNSILNVTGFYENSEMKVIASGGIRTGINVAKCICLGANVVGIASPFLKTAEKDIKSGGEPKDSIKLIKTLIEELKITMVLTGSAKISDLNVDKIEPY
jgi:isopentenyl-diphosphate delta-isomerase